MKRTIFYIAASTLFCWLFLNCTFLSMAHAQERDRIDVATYNVESPRFCNPDSESGQPSETLPEVVAQHIQDLAGPDLWALSEVPDQEAADQYKSAANFSGSDFELILGTQGSCSDLLAILYNQNRMELIGEPQQLIAEVGGDRDPLAARFRLIPDGTEFWAVANHFARGNEDSRNRQAERLRGWIETQSIPVIALGDFNMDFSVDLSLADTRPDRCSGTIEEGNTAFNIFTGSSDIRWIQPECLSNGTCPREGTGCFLPCFNSILDFIFVGGPAASEWTGTSTIGFSDVANYCENDPLGDTDHRPVLATLTFPTGQTFAQSRIRISELFPNPIGGNFVEERNESATLENFGSETVDLDGWLLRDRNNSTWSLSGSIPPGQTITFRRNGQAMSLNNNGDLVTLVDALGQEIDSVSYSSASENETLRF